MIEIIFVITNISFLSHLYKDGVKNSLKENVFIISNLIKEYDKKDYQQIFENSDMRFNIIGLNGKVIYDSRKYNEEGKLENHGNRREVLEVKNAGIGFDIRKSSISDETMAYYAVERSNKEGEKVVVRVSKNYGETLKMLKIILVAELLFFTL